MSEGLRSTQVECPWCGRTVEVFDHPDLGLVMLGHRVSMPHTPETPWCKGGGRKPKGEHE